MLFHKKEPAGGPMEFLVVGLGNPGIQYECTRHNAGFLALRALADKQGVTVDRVKFHALIGPAVIGEKRGLLMLPQTYMNESGRAVSEAMRFYKLRPEQVVVLFDDIALPVGQLRIRRKGSGGGQKGMGSIIAEIGSENFPRVRLGVGEKPHPDYDLAAWVLSKFTESEQKTMDEAAARAADAVCLMVSGDIDGAMNRYSR